MNAVGMRWPGGDMDRPPSGLKPGWMAVASARHLSLGWLAQTGARKNEARQPVVHAKHC